MGLGGNTPRIIDDWGQRAIPSPTGQHPRSNTTPRAAKKVTGPGGWPVFPARQFQNADGPPPPRTTNNVRSSLRQALQAAGIEDNIYPHLLRSTVATFVARRMSVADAGALLGHRADSSVTTRHYIERLRLAPDTSAVLQALIEIGEAEARAEESGGWEEVPPDDGEFRADQSAGLSARRVAGENDASQTAKARRREQRRAAARADDHAAPDHPPSTTPPAPSPPPVDAESPPASRTTERPSGGTSAGERVAARWTQGELEWG